MGKKGLVVLVLILCLGLLLTGCPKKTVVKEEPSMRKAEEPVAEREKAAKLAAVDLNKVLKKDPYSIVKERGRVRQWPCLGAVHAHFNPESFFL